MLSGSMSAPETTANPSPDSWLQPGTLWQRVRSQTRHGLQCGALQPIETDCKIVEQAGIPFLVRILHNLSRKDKARKAEAKQSAQSGKDFNPFLPYETDLFVADLSPSHLCLLNKFNVVPHHLLIVTRAFADQETWLTQADFEALWCCLREVEGLAFYNSGAIAGASQRHKHLQLVPFPLGEATTDSAIPIEPSIAAANYQNGIGTLPHFPFRHAIAPLKLSDESPTEAAVQLLARYHQLLAAVGWDPQTDEVPPYNWLATRQWMLLVPRSQECYQGISINSLGFAGALLVRNQPQLDLLRQCGPLEILSRVACSAETSP